MLMEGRADGGRTDVLFIDQRPCNFDVNGKPGPAGAGRHCALSARSRTCDVNGGDGCIETIDLIEMKKNTPDGLS
jgi:hypothetical protein